MIQINLLPDVKQEYIRAKRMRNSVISISILVGIGAGALVAVLLLIWGGFVVREKGIDKDIESQYVKLTETDNLSEILTLQSQFAAIGEQHKNKTITSRLFSVLNSINSPDDRSVGFTSIQLTPAEKILSIEGSTPNGYKAVESLSKTISNVNIEFERDGNRVVEPLAVSVVPGETSLQEDDGSGQKVSFTFTITVNENLFSNSAKKLAIILPDGRSDVTDSRIGVPENLFVPGKGGDDE